MYLKWWLDKLTLVCHLTFSELSSLATLRGRLDCRGALLWCSYCLLYPTLHSTFKLSLKQTFAHIQSSGSGRKGEGGVGCFTSLGFYAALVVNYYYLPQRGPWHWTCRGAVYFHFFIYCALFSQSSRFVFVNFEYGLGQRSVSNSKRRLQHCIMNSSIDKRVTQERHKQKENERDRERER